MSRTKKEKDDEKRKAIAAKGGVMVVGSNRSPAHGAYSKGPKLGRNSSPPHGAYSKGRLLRETRVRKSKLAGLTFPVSRFERKLRKGDYAKRISGTAPVYLTAVIEYLIAEICDISKEAASVHKRKKITPRHINLAIKHDAELRKLLKDVTVAGGGVVEFIQPVLLMKPKRKPSKKKTKKASSVQSAEVSSAQSVEESSAQSVEEASAQSAEEASAQSAEISSAQSAEESSAQSAEESPEEEASATEED